MAHTLRLGMTVAELHGQAGNCMRHLRRITPIVGEVEARLTSPSRYAALTLLPVTRRCWPNAPEVPDEQTTRIA